MNKKTVALTEEQYREIISTIRNGFVCSDGHIVKPNSRIATALSLEANLGLRISEFCGLTLDDIDMENRKIKIDHQLQRTREGVYLIEDTKTTYGERILPMSEGVYQCFQKLIKKRKKWKVEPMVDGKAGFLVLDKNGMPYLALHWEKRFEYALGKYNRIFKEELPIITPHICRHTYCTNMAKAGISPKSLQYLMGHSDIATTLGYYTHYKFNDVEKEVRELERRLSGE